MKCVNIIRVSKLYYNFLKQIDGLSDKVDKALSTIGNHKLKLLDYDSRYGLNNKDRLGLRSLKEDMLVFCRR